jgi:thiol-disulfide isomerase/thioredoxin
MVKSSVTSPRSNRSTLRRLLTAGVSLTLVASACGSDDTASDAVDEIEAVADEPIEAESTEEAPVDESSDEPAVEEILENRPVEVTGDALAVYDSTIPDDTIGTAAPVIAGQSFDGTAVTLGGASDNPTMIVFLAHWCPHCNDEIPELVSLNDAGSIPEGLDVIGVSTAVDPGASNYPPSEWIVEKEWPWATMADDEELSAIAAMGGSSFPFTVILDADGNVLARRGGSATADATLEFINAALG